LDGAFRCSTSSATRPSRAHSGHKRRRLTHVIAHVP